jgi:NitT/TauT family transport system ATP-binding protein
MGEISEYSKQNREVQKVPGSMKHKIVLKNLTKIFQTRRQSITAVENVNMQFDQGDFVSILGPSGCGKSTIIRMINDIIKPSAGEILIDGKDITEYKRIPKETIRKMGFIFQQPNMYPWRTVKENVELPLKIFGLKGKEWESYTDELIDLVGLTPYKNKYPTEISGGSLQRAGVIRAMVHKPEILLMDEPFGALDETTMHQMNIELLEIWKKTQKTIIFITHSVEEAVLLSNRVYVMGTNPGRVVDEVTIDLPRPRTLEMLSDNRFIEYCKYLTAKIGHIDLSKIK